MAVTQYRFGYQVSGSPWLYSQKDPSCTVLGIKYEVTRTPGVTAVPEERSCVDPSLRKL